MMNACFDTCYMEQDGKRPPQDEDLPWTKQRVESPETPRLWRVSLLRDFLACIGLRTGVRTGNFKLRMAVWRRLAPMLCTPWKGRYQSLAAHHPFDFPAMPDTDLKVLSARLSMSVRGDPFGCLGSDEQQEMSNTCVETVTDNLSPSSLKRVTALTDLRHNAVSEVANLGLFTASYISKILNDIVAKETVQLRRKCQR